MITYYFLLKHPVNQYIKITCESERFAKDVFLFLHPSGYESISQQKPFAKKLYEEIQQRKTT